MRGIQQLNNTPLIVWVGQSGNRLVATKSTGYGKQTGREPYMLIQSVDEYIQKGYVPRCDYEHLQKQNEKFRLYIKNIEKFCSERLEELK